MVRLHSPLPPCLGTKKLCGPVVQLVRMPACHAGGRRFEPVPGRHNLILYMVGIVKWLRHMVVVHASVGSIPTTHPIDGASPSGKAMDSDSIMRRFESCRPSHM